MSRFLFVAGGGGGNVPPELAVIRELVAAGHEVDFLGVPWIEPQITSDGVARTLRDQVAEAGARPVGFDQWTTAEADVVQLPPLVVMSPTTTSLALGQVDFVKASIEALGSQPVRGVVTVGPQLDPNRFDAPDNVAVAGRAEHGALLGRASALITHCGHGTVMTALAVGVPLIGVPDFADQRDIGARILDHGLGVVLDKPVTPAQINEALERVLDDPAFASNARRFATTLQPLNGPSLTADVLSSVALLRHSQLSKEVPASLDAIHQHLSRRSVI